MTTPQRIVGWVLGISLLVAGCRARRDRANANATAPEAEKIEPVSLNGAGATFPYPLYSKWMIGYNRLHPDNLINYQPIGSGGGIRQLIARTVDFGATDVPMTRDEAALSPAKIVPIPMMIGAVAIPYNLAGISDLKLTPEALAGIYLGAITKWSDPELAQTNPTTKLPDQSIVIVHQSDGSGTTAVFTDYLSKVSPAWNEQVGAGKSVRFPVGLGAKGNEGVARQVKTTPFALGYVELAYAVRNALPMARLENESGRFVKPDPAGETAAAAGVEMPDSLQVSITNAAGDDAYPISSFSYLLVYREVPDATKGKVLVSFIEWVVHDGQKLTEPLGYAPLPADVVAKIEARLKGLTSGGKPLLSAR